MRQGLIVKFVLALALELALILWACAAQAQPCTVTLVPPASGDATAVVQQALNTLPASGCTICFANGPIPSQAPWT